MVCWVFGAPSCVVGTLVGVGVYYYVVRVVNDVEDHYSSVSINV